MKLCGQFLHYTFTLDTKKKIFQYELCITRTAVAAIIRIAK